MTVGVVGGPGVVGRSGDALLVCLPGGGDEARDRLLATMAAVRAESGPAGGRLARRLLDLLAGAASGAIPAFAALAPLDDRDVDGRRWALVLHGAVRVEIAGPEGVRRLSGRDAATWLDRIVPGGFTSLTVLPHDADTVDVPPHLDLREGLVPGCGLVLRPATPRPGARPATAVEPDRARPPPPHQPVPAPHRSRAAVTVDGIRCERGHFNHPNALRCSTCAAPLAERTRTLVPGPRPPLGVLQTDEGATFPLDRDYVVGRRPDEDAAVAAGTAAALRLTDAQRSVSRVHAEVRLDGWDVLVLDRGSANGTFVQPSDSGGWTRLAPGAPLPITPGTRVAFGKRVTTYQAAG